ncbi:30S ribosomal protein S1 [Peptococcaceae bacterium]|nr:30S ribosomal protein S1 [Peptococcaceae bacterium]
MEDGESVEGVVREIVNGGLIVDIGVRAFLPASLLDVVYVEDLTQYLNKTLKLKIIEMNKPKRKIIVSRKTLIEEERARAKQELFDKLEVGQVIRGTVQRLTEFGAFVDIGGVDGLLHISEIAWHRVDHPSDVLKEGDEVEVKVLKIDKDAEKVSLSLKQALPDPWEKVDSKYKVGDIIKVKVVRLAPFGAFVQLEPGVEGLIHISHLAKHHVEKPEDVVKEGEEVEVKVLSVDKDEKRIRLSIREAKKEAEIIERKQKQKKKQSSEEKDIKDDDSNDDSIALLGDAMPPELAEMAKMAKQ